MSLQIMYILIFYIFNCTIRHSIAATCEISEQCVGQALHEDVIFANGYKSVTGSNSSMKCKKCECEASFSCHSISFIKSTDEMDCDGDNACASAALLQSLVDIGCDGANSCSSATISNTTLLACSGEQSCAHSSISDVEQIHVGGAYGLLNATINNKHTDLLIWLYSHHAAFGATLICHASRICRITCSGNACSHFYVSCIGQCMFKGDILPQPMKAISQFNASATDLFYDSKQISAQNDMECNNGASLTMDDSYEVDNATSISSDTTICCRGLYSCSGLHEYELLIYIERNHDHNKVICSGTLSCWGSYMDHYTGSVFCGGQKACYGSFINSTKSLHCQTPKACCESNIYNTEHVLCTGRKSCDSAQIYSSGSHKTHFYYFYGNRAGSGAVIHCKKSDTCVILCKGLEACHDAVVHCEQGCSYNVTCDKDTFCPITFTIKPTMYPTIPPTMFPTIYMSETPLLYTTNQSIIAPHDAHHSHQSHTMKNNDIFIGMLFIGLIAIITAILLAAACLFHSRRRGTDPPGYLSLTRFFGGIADWYTDVLWTYTLYVEGHYLFTVGAIFVFGSHFISIAVGLFWITRWRQNRTQISVAEYANKYDKFVICLSVVSGFYNATALITSHLFHFDALSMHLDEKHKKYIATVRILNNSVIENIPVLIIQILYLRSIHSSDANFITLLAMFFTITSILAMVLTLVERSVNHVMNRGKAENVLNEIMLEFILQAVEKEIIKTYHIHTHMRLTDAIHSAVEILKSQIKIQRIQKVMRGIKVNVNLVSLDNEVTCNIMNGLQDIHDLNQSALYCALLNECKDQLHIHWGSITLRIVQIELRQTNDNAIGVDQQRMLQNVEMTEHNWDIIQDDNIQEPD